MPDYDVIQGDARGILARLPERAFRCCVTSPPYWGLRDYGVEGQAGLEKDPNEYVEKMVEVFREVRRVLADDGTLWLNVGDSYAQAGGPGWQGKNGQRADRRFTLVRDSVAFRDIARKPPEGMKQKDLVGIPWMLAFALRADGWYLRSDIIWSKPNPMPESIKDRPTRSHEYIFLLAKSKRYYYDFEAVQEEAIHAGKRVSLGEKSLSKGQATGMNRAPSGNGMKEEVIVSPFKNLRSVWRIGTQPYKEAHFAVMPEKLVEPCVRAGSAPGDAVLDPFCGSGTVGVAALREGRDFCGIDLNSAYCEIARARIEGARQCLTTI